jgi:hypothetical protein
MQSALQKNKTSGTKPQRSPARFLPDSAIQLDQDAIAFGRAMQGFLHGKAKFSASEDEILGILIQLGYRHRSRRRLGSLNELKRQKAGFPTWSEVLQAVKNMGWFLDPS